MAEDEFTLDSKCHLEHIDLEHPTSAYDFQSLLCGTEKKVLKLGPTTSHISKILKERGCHVTEIEIPPISIKQVTKFTDKIILEDIEILNLSESLGSEKYDVILLGDFLEHVKRPSKLLKKLQNFLAQNGYIVCSVLNVAHITKRLKLLDGKFGNESARIFNEDHLHFFTLDTVLSMLETSGYVMTKLHRVKQNFDLKHHIDFKPYVIPTELIESILRDPEATTFQYVFSATPTSHNNIITREYLSEFSKNITTERLGEIFQYYKEYLHNIFEKRILEKDLQICNLRKELLKSLKSERNNQKMTKSSEPDRRITELEISIFYNEVLGREPDEAGLQHYLNNILCGKMSLEEVKHTINSSDEALDRRKKTS